MNYRWNIMISWLLLQFLVPVQSYTKEVTIPVSSPIQLECDDDLRVNKIDVAIRRINTSCWTTTEECSLPLQTIDTIKEKCNKQVSCEVDIRHITDIHHCLYEYGFLNVWYTCKKILDFSCDFESGLCNWFPEQDENRFRWKHGNRLGHYTKPSVDHTSASTAGKYVYIYAANSKLDDIANLESGEIVAVEQQCLSFWYFTTNSRDSVYVYQNEEELFDLSDKEEQKWHHMHISLKKKSYDSFKLFFKVVRGRWYGKHFGAISIDDILIENQNCNSSVLNCDFESNSCDWNNDESNQYVWKRQNGQLPLYHTGPTTDHSTASDSGNYMYLDGTEDTVAIFEFQNVDLTVSGNCCLTFWYHMYNYYYYEKKRLNVSIDNELVWTESGNQDNKWKKGIIDLHNRNIISIKFIGIFGSNIWNNIYIAIDDISLDEGTCKGLFVHEEMCFHLDEKTPEETECPKSYLNITNLHLSFDPEKTECSTIYDKTKQSLLEECENRDDSQKCLIDFSTDKSYHPECFQLYEFRITHTCEDEETTTVSSDSTSGDSSPDVQTTTVSSFTTSKVGSSTVSDESVTLPRVMRNSSDSATGLVVGLVIGALLLVCVVILIVILIRRHTFKSNPKEKIRNNIGGNDYIGSQDIALPITANHSNHMQNNGMYDGTSNASVHGYDSTNANAHINNVQHEYTNVGAVNGFVNKEKVQVPTYAHRQHKTFADNYMSNDDEYAINNPTAETSFNGSIYNRTGNADMVLDPTKTGFNRQIFSNTPTGYEFAKPVKATENQICDEDQYDISDEGVYDHSGSNRHKESEDNIYNHAVDTIYDSGSHKRNDEGREDTYDHFCGEKNRR